MDEISVLKVEMKVYMDNALAPSTARNYKRYLQGYKSFCNNHSLQEYAQEGLCLFVTSLARRLKFESIKQQLAAIQYFAPDHVKLSSMIELRHLLIGIGRTIASKPGRANRLPITTEQLYTISRYLLSHVPQPDAAMLWCAATMAYYALLRVSEFAAPSGKRFSEATLLVSDVELSEWGIKLNIKTAKTDPFHHGATITVGRNNSPLCPKRAAAEYIELRGSKPGPFFQYQNGVFLSTRLFNKLISNCITNK